MKINSNKEKMDQINNRDYNSHSNANEVNSGNTEIAVFGGGCFWCLEAAFKNVIGIIKVESGYAGGLTQNPTYEQVCSGSTNHAEK